MRMPWQARLPPALPTQVHSMRAPQCSWHGLFGGPGTAPRARVCSVGASVRAPAGPAARLLVDAAADVAVDLAHVVALDAQQPPQPVQLLGALICAAAPARAPDAHAGCLQCRPYCLALPDADAHAPRRRPACIPPPGRWLHAQPLVACQAYLCRVAAAEDARTVPQVTACAPPAWLLSASRLLIGQSRSARGGGGPTQGSLNLTPGARRRCACPRPAAPPGARGTAGGAGRRPPPRRSPAARTARPARPPCSAPRPGARW